MQTTNKLSIYKCKTRSGMVFHTDHFVHKGDMEVRALGTVYIVEANAVESCELIAELPQTI